MDLLSIGNLNSYIKNLKLQSQWTLKQQTGQYDAKGKSLEDWLDGSPRQAQETAYGERGDKTLKKIHQKLEAGGLECVEIKQHSSVLHPPTKLLKESILGGHFAYDDNRLLEINFQNARCTEDTNLNQYVNKKKSAGKVDMVVALINALYMAQQELLYGRFDFVVQT